MLEKFLIPAVVAAVAVFVGVMTWAVVKPEPFQPISYEVQRVVEIREDGTEVIPIIPGQDELIPAVYVGEQVPVIGAVCNEHDRPVNVSGTVTWNSLDPLGFNIRTGEGRNTVGPGCRALGPFENHMPQEVIDYVNDAGEPKLFHISGRVNIDEDNGGVTSWVTEAFWVVPLE